jgi:hypothetical protein
MNSKTYLKILLASFLVGIGISMVGCGASGGGESSPVPPATTTTAQTTTVVNGYTPNNCYGGSIVPALDGTQVCQIQVTPELNYSYSSYGAVPRVSSSNAGASSMPLYGVQIQPNDKLTITDLSGGWGTGSLFNRSHCEDITTTGRNKNDGTTVTNETVPSGLFLSTGSAAYPAFGTGVIYFNEAGTLRYGFNAPASSGNCFSLSIRFKVERCLDVASLPHKCK